MVVVLVLLAITVAVGIRVPSLRFFNLVPIALLLGIGFTSLVQGVLPIKNIATFIIISLFLGLFLNTLIIFLFGILGTSINLVFFSYYIPIAFAVNLAIFFFSTKENQIREYVKNIKLEIIDIIWIVILSILLVILVSTCLEAFFPSWDSFTFWALDSKYIFENAHLRDGSYALLSNNYLSFFPLQINYVYQLYGAIVEQTAGLLSVIYAYVGVALVSSYLIDIKGSLIKKSLIYFGLVVALYSFFTTHFVLLMSYADVFLSIIVLLYALVLFNKDYKIEDYWKRFLLIVLLSITLYLTKTHYLALAIFLLGFYVVFDFKVIIKNIKKIISNPFMIISILALLGYLFFVRKYAQGIVNESGFTESIVSKIAFTSGLLTNFSNVIRYLFTQIPLFVCSLFILLLGTFFVKKEFEGNDMWKIAFLILLMAFPTSLYVFKILPLSDSSLLRYLGLTFFAIPLLFTRILPDIEIKRNWQKILATFAIVCVPVLLVGQIYMKTGFDLKFTPTSGSYKDFSAIDKSGVNKYFFVQSGYYKIAEEVLKIIPKNSTLMVLDYVKDQGQVANTFEPGLAVRYYLSENNLGGPYSCVSAYCYTYFLTMNPDYLVLYSYEGYWPECNSMLETKGSYLIKLDKSGEFLKSNSCIANLSNTTKL